MKMTARKLVKHSVRSMSVMALSMLVLFGTSLSVSADEADARRLLKAMSDYLAVQKALSFEYDASLEVITTDDQRLELAGSGDVILYRPGKIRATRASGFADFEILFDGETVTLFNSSANLYSQINLPGTVDKLIDLLGGDIAPPPLGPAFVL